MALNPKYGAIFGWGGRGHIKCDGLNFRGGVQFYLNCSVICHMTLLRLKKSKATCHLPHDTLEIKKVESNVSSNSKPELKFKLIFS